MNIWPLICFFFFVYSFGILKEESNEITYVSTEGKGKIQYLICFNLKDEISIYRNKSEISLDQLKNDLKHHFEFTFLNYQIDEKNEKFNLSKELILNSMKTKDYFIFKDSFCLIQENQDDFILITPYIKNPKYYAFKANSFDFFELLLDPFFLYDKDNYRILFFINEDFDQLDVLSKSYPYSNCLENYSQFICLNDCFKRNRLAKYYYGANESEQIYLNYDPNNKSIIEHEYNCSIKCQWEDCKLTHFELNYDRFKGGKITTYEAIFLIASFDYWTQLIGLFSLITGIYLDQLLSLLTKFVIRRIKRIKNLKKYLICLKVLALLLSLVYPLIYYIEVIKTLHHKIKSPTNDEIKNYLIEPEQINLAVCIPIEILANDLTEHNKIESFENKTFAELEKETNIDLNNSIDIFLRFGNKKIETDWKVSNKVLFKNLQRCFQIEVNPKEPKYRNLISITKLIIKPKFLKEFNLFILSKNKNLHSESYQHNNYFRFSKKQINRLDTNEKCINYEKFSYCKSQQECIERCTIRKLLEKFKNISINSLLVIHKDYFSQNDWQISYPKINHSLIVKEIKWNCDEKFNIEHCEEIRFQTNYEIKNPPTDRSIKEIDLYYDVIKKIRNKPSIYKLIIDILNIQSILFGLNVFKLLMLFFFLFKFKFGNEKTVHFIIQLLCSAGFIYHTYFILNEVLHGDLIHFIYYNLMSSIKMPDIIFCLEMNQTKIDDNMRLTGNYLNQITQQMNTNELFEKIVYLNRSNQWTNWNAEFKNDDFEIKEIYFLDQKCFSIEQKIEYHKNQIKLLNDTKVLKIEFNLNFVNQNKLIFLTKLTDSMQLSRSIDIEFNRTEYFELPISIDQEFFEIIYNDKFVFLKNPLSLFQDEIDENNYLFNLSNNFEQTYKLSTLNLPSKKSTYEIDDNLFEQFLSQIQNVTDHNRSTDESNYRRLFIKNLSEFSGTNDADLDFKLNFLKKILLITNDDNIIRLLLSLLNCLSLWFDLNIFQFDSYLFKVVTKFCLILNFVYKFLLKLREYFFHLLL